jgi:hypothetical protein
MDFHIDTLLNLPNVIADSYSSTLDAVIINLQFQKLVNKALNKIRLALQLKGLKNRYLLTSNQSIAILIEFLRKMVPIDLGKIKF